MAAVRAVAVRGVTAGKLPKKKWTPLNLERQSGPAPSHNLCKPDKVTAKWGISETLRGLACG